MRKIFLAAAAASMAVPIIPAPAVAHSGSYYKGKVWRDSEGRYRCKRSNGTTGLIVGAVVVAIMHVLPFGKKDEH